MLYQAAGEDRVDIVIGKSRASVELRKSSRFGVDIPVLVVQDGTPAVPSAQGTYVERPAAGAEEQGTPETARAALVGAHPTLETWIRQMQGTIEVVAQGQPDTFDMEDYFPDAELADLAREAGYAKGLVLVVPGTKLDSAALPGLSMTLFVQDQAGWRETVRKNLNLQGAVDRGEIRFTADAAEANIIIGEKDAVPLRPGQVFIGANSQTIHRVTLGLFSQLEQKGLLAPGSVVMLYSAPKDSVLIFA